MRNLDGIDLRLVERTGDRPDVVKPILVADGMHAVAEGDVLDVELGLGWIEGHAAILSAIFSAVFIAAEVMMSRLPA